MQELCSPQCKAQTTALNQSEIKVGDVVRLFPQALSLVALATLRGRLDLANKERWQIETRDGKVLGHIHHSRRERAPVKRSVYEIHLYRLLVRRSGIKDPVNLGSYDEALVSTRHLLQRTYIVGEIAARPPGV